MWTYFIDEPLRLFYKIHSYTSKEHFIRSCHAHHSSQTYDHICNKKSQIWEKPHRRPSHRESYWLQWDAPHLPPKLPLTLRQSPLPSNTSIPRPITLTTPNGIQIQSAVLSQYRQTDTWDLRQAGKNTKPAGTNVFFCGGMECIGRMWHCGVDVAYPWLSDWNRVQWALHS